MARVKQSKFIQPIRPKARRLELVEIATLYMKEFRLYKKGAAKHDKDGNVVRVKFSPKSLYRLNRIYMLDYQITLNKNIIQNTVGKQLSNKSSEFIKKLQRKNKILESEIKKYFKAFTQKKPNSFSVFLNHFNAWIDDNRDDNRQMIEDEDDKDPLFSHLIRKSKEYEKEQKRRKQEYEQLSEDEKKKLLKNARKELAAAIAEDEYEIEFDKMTEEEKQKQIEIQLMKFDEARTQHKATRSKNIK